MGAGVPLSAAEERALLHVLDAVCGLPSVSVDSSGAAASSSTRCEGDEKVVTKKKATAKKKRRHTTPTRDREAKELRQLRVDAIQLAARLERLRAAIVSSRGSGADAKQQNAWRHVARRQLVRRRQAERERERLEREVQAHKALHQSIQAGWLGLSGLDESATAGSERSALEERDRAVLDRLASQLDLAYALVGVALPPEDVSARDASRLLHAAVDATSWLDAEPGLEAQRHLPTELRDEFTIPFALERVVDAVWKAWVQWHVGGASRITGVSSAHCTHAHIDRPEDTFAVKFRLKSSLSGNTDESTYLNETLVVRRYVEADRLVLVWRGTSETDHAGLDAVLTDETGWIVVERVHCEHRQPVSLFGEESNGAGVNAARCGCGGRTALRSYVRMVPQTRSKGSDGPAAPREAAAATLASLVAGLYKQDVNFINREMETLLIRGAHRSSGDKHQDPRPVLN